MEPILKEGEVLETVNERLRLIHKKDGLTLGTDAYLLAAFASGTRGGHCVDLGSGTGIVSLLLLARRKFETARAVEIQSEFCDLIRRNASLNDMGNRLTVTEGDIRSLSAAEMGGQSDAVFANPPYRPAGSGVPSPKTAKRIACQEQNGGIADFCRAASGLLNFGGRFYCVFPADRAVDLFCSMREVSLEPKRAVCVHTDAESAPFILLCEARRGGAPGIRWLPPLILHERSAPTALSPRAQRIYDTCSFDEEPIGGTL